ncbi:hypothetical protein FS749_013547 [Ceratobasidium sp. UAMH 11750]|nr:hypothetical protein FS749_013547 [Ceratobasidium sp. UAMH 11750]
MIINLIFPPRLTTGNLRSIPHTYHPTSKKKYTRVTAPRCTHSSYEFRPARHGEKKLAASIFDPLHDLPRLPVAPHFFPFSDLDCAPVARRLRHLSYNLRPLIAPLDKVQTEPSGGP